MSNLIKRVQVTEKTSLSRSQVYALAKKGLFPKPVKLSEFSVAWVESEVDEWIANRIAAREGVKSHG